MRTELKLETGETTEINGETYTKVTSNFLNPDNKKLYFYYDHKNEMFTDRRQAHFNVLSAHVDPAVIDWVVARYYCQRGNLRELQSDDPGVLIQAMLAVYSWCEMKEWLK